MSRDIARNLRPLEVQDDSDSQGDGDRATVPFNLADLAIESERNLARTPHPPGEPPTVKRGLAVLAPSQGNEHEAKAIWEMPQRARYESAVHARSVAGTVPPIPDLNHVPYLVLTETDIEGFESDESTGIVLACVDGNVTVQTILAIATLPPADTLRIIGELGVAGVLGLR